MVSFLVSDVEQGSASKERETENFLDGLAHIGLAGGGDEGVSGEGETGGGAHGGGAEAAASWVCNVVSERERERDSYMLQNTGEKNERKGGGQTNTSPIQSPNTDISREGRRKRRKRKRKNSRK